MKAKLYDCQTFMETDVPDWLDKELKDYLKEMGYRPDEVQSYGSRAEFEAPTLDIYEQREPSELPQFMCIFSYTHECYELICVRDGFNLALLINFLAPSLSLGIMQTVYNTLLEDEYGHINQLALPKLNP